MSASEERCDDLHKITGIGKARQQWLKATFGVCTFGDLAALRAPEVVARLRDEGHIASQAAIEKWIADAQELAAEGGPSSTPEPRAKNETAVAKWNSEARENGWKPFASFVVEFQTRMAGDDGATQLRTAVHHMEADLDDHWPGIEAKSLCEWMLDQVRAKAESLSDEKAESVRAELGEPPGHKTPPARVQITQIRGYQPPESETPVHSIPAASHTHRLDVQVDEPLRFEVEFELFGPQAPDVAAAETAFKSRSYAYDKASKISFHLGDSKPRRFEGGTDDYVLRTPEFTMQEGEYRLWIIVSPEGAVTTPDFIELTDLHVVV
jgi:hypothetical protein